jgi:hypothetical protein
MWPTRSWKARTRDALRRDRGGGLSGRDGPDQAAIIENAEKAIVQA